MPSETLRAFVVYAIREMLNPESLDSFRGALLNTHSRAEELVEVLERSSIRRPRIWPLFRELAVSVHEDPALSQDTRDSIRLLLRQARDWLGGKNLPTILDKADERARRDASKQVIKEVDALVQEDYRTQLKRRIDRSTSSVNRDWMGSALYAYRLARTLLSELQWRGFEERHLRQQTNALLPRARDSTLSSWSAHVGHATFQRYLGSFDSPARTWQVIFFASGTFDSHRQTARAHNFSIFRLKAPSKAHGTRPELPSDLQLSPEAAKLVGDHAGRVFRQFPVLVVVRGIRSLDADRARTLSESGLFFLAATCRAFLETVKFSWHPVSVVSDGSSGEATFTKRTAGALENRRQLRRPRELRGVPNWVVLTRKVINRSTVDLESKSTLANALEFHRAASEITKPEAQLLVLWAGLESLKSDESTNNFFQGISRILSWRYCQSVLGCVAARLVEFAEVKNLHQAWRAGWDGDDAVLREDALAWVVAVLVCRDLDSERQKLLAAISKCSYLRYQAEVVRGMFRSNSSIRKSLTRHRAKVAWNLNRVYIARNEVIHNAGTAYRMEVLVETARSYLVAVIEAIVEVLAKRVEITSVPQALAVSRESYLSSKSCLQGDPLECELGNYRNLLGFSRETATSSYYKANAGNREDGLPFMF